MKQKTPDSQAVVLPKCMLNSKSLMCKYRSARRKGSCIIGKVISGNIIILLIGYKYNYNQKKFIIVTILKSC